MFERLNEVSSRAKNFQLKADQLENELLTRNLFEAEFAQIVAVIKSIVGRSRLSPREQAGVQRNLERLNGIFDSVARAQNKSGAGSVESATKSNGNGSNDDDN